MPTDVFLMLCSSSLAVVASLMYFVSDGPFPLEDEADAVPLPRPRRRPPPLPATEACTVALGGLGVDGKLRLECLGDEWRISLQLHDRADGPARAVVADPQGHWRAIGTVNDLRWHGRAGLSESTRATWRSPPGRA